MSSRLSENAILLAHNYQTPEIYHGVADYTGDSLGLAQKASETDADVIILCGVEFMAETAKILNPEKKVLVPDLRAGCSLADSITGEGRSFTEGTLSWGSSSYLCKYKC